MARAKPIGQGKKELLGLLEASIKRNAPKEQFGMLFSGGLDSALLAILCKRLGLKFKCFFGYVEGYGKPKDLEFAEKAAKQLGLQLETAPLKAEDVPWLILDIVPLINSTSPVHVSVALPLFIACQKARQSGVNVIFSGMGADEVFCGYAKFRNSKDVAADSMLLVQKLPENDLQRDLAIAAANGLQLKTPFLGADMLKFGLSLPRELKLSRDRNKIILRELAKDLGMSAELAERKKLAAQYGSNSDKAIARLAKKAGLKSKTAFLEKLAAEARGKGSYAKGHGMKVAALFSGGKDSCLALWMVQQLNFDVKCLVSILPENPDSFMYHKPNPKILALQSKALGIPLILKETKGEKEKELLALEQALVEAKRRFGVGAVVSGALFSEYQRKRIQGICDSLGLRDFLPLWQKKQVQELQLLLDSGFDVIVSKIAASGLSKEWLGRRIGKQEMEKLQELSEKSGFNAAGEGGEFESIVLDAPNFSKRIRIEKAEKRMENEFTGTLEIKKAVLEEK